MWLRKIIIAIAMIMMIPNICLSLNREKYTKDEFESYYLILKSTMYNPKVHNIQTELAEEKAKEIVKDATNIEFMQVLDTIVGFIEIKNLPKNGSELEKYCNEINTLAKALVAELPMVNEALISYERNADVIVYPILASNKNECEIIDFRNQ